MIKTKIDNIRFDKKCVGAATKNITLLLSRFYRGFLIFDDNMGAEGLKKYFYRKINFYLSAATCLVRVKCNGQSRTYTERLTFNVEIPEKMVDINVSEN